MARYKPYNANQSRLVPITLSEHIYEGSLEEAIHLTVEEDIDLLVNEEEFKKFLIPELKTVDEVANYLQMKVKTIQNWTSAKTIPIEYAGGYPRYRKATIDKWLIQKRK